MTEPDAGTDTTNIRTTARRVDGGYLVRGQKIWTSKALNCDKVLLLVRTEPIEASPQAHRWDDSPVCRFATPRGDHSTHSEARQECRGVL